MDLRVKLPENLLEKAIVILKDQLLKEIGDKILFIMFFGSRQRGTFSPDSDIDLLIILKTKDQHIVNKIFDLADRIERDILSYRFSFSLHIQSKHEFKRFQEMKSTFLREIETDGAVIYAGKTQS